MEPTAGVGLRAPGSRRASASLQRRRGSTRACALRGRRASDNTSSTWSRLEDSNPDSPVIGRTSCLLDEAWVGPAGWSRTSMVPLKRLAHDRSATTGYDERQLAVGPGLEPGSCRVTGGRVAVATTLQTKRGRRNGAGCQTWTRRLDTPRSGAVEPRGLMPAMSPTTIRGVRGRCPAVRRSGNGRVGRTRTSTHLRPRQVGYRLPYDPKK
jgi:hypothetical protein